VAAENENEESKALGKLEVTLQGGANLSSALAAPLRKHIKSLHFAGESDGNSIFTKSPKFFD
jgi:hypothetical protein